MKFRNAIIMFAVSGLIVACSGSGEDANSGSRSGLVLKPWQEFIKNKKIKEIKAVAYGYQFGEPSLDYLTLYECRYNNLGLLTDSLLYRNNKMHMQEQYRYDGQNRLIEKSVLDSVGKVLHKAVSQVNELGLETQFEAFKSDTLYYIEKKYYNDTLLIKTEIFSGKKQEGSTEFEYYPSGLLSSKTEKDAKGNIVNRTKYGLDDKNRVVSISFYGATGRLMEKTLLKEYDAKDNAKLVEKFNHKDSLVAYYKYEYNQDGYETKAMIYDGVGRVLRQDNVTYDKNNNKIDYEIYQIEKGLVGKESKKFNHFNKMVEMIDADGKGNQIKKKVVSYNENQLMISEMSLDKIDEPTLLIKYEYVYF